MTLHHYVRFHALVADIVSMVVRIRSVYVVSALFWLCLGQGPPRDGEVPYGRDRFYQTYSSAAVSPDESRYCSTDFSLVGSYPRGFAENGRDGFDSVMTLLENEQMTKTGCLQSCCALGPQRCRYVWIFKTKCFAINCSSYPANCEPVSVPSHIPPSVSVYIHVHYIRDGTLPGNPPPPTSVPPYSVATSSYVDSSLRAIITPSETETHKSEVYLSAKNSSTTHQGELEYLWELMSVEPSQNMISMSGTNTDTLYLSGMSSGTYTIRLTVKDMINGNKDRATTTVIVLLPAPSELPTSVLSTSAPPAPPVPLPHNITDMRGPTISSTDHSPTEATTQDQTTQDQTPPTATTSTAKHPPLHTAAQVQEVQDMKPIPDKSSGIILKVGVPVLSIVLLILVVSGCIVAASSCVFLRSEKRKYRYRKLMTTDT